MSTADASVPMSPTANEIARVAASLFAKHGYDATPVNAIVEAAGVTKPTLYYHFKSKEGLAQALMTRPLDRHEAALKALLDREGDPIRRLVDCLEAHLAFVREDPDRVRFIYAISFGPNGRGLAADLMQFAQRIDAILIASIRKLAEASLVADERVASLFAMARGMIIVTTMDMLYCGFEPGPEFCPNLIDDMLRGFAEPGRYKGIPG